MKIFAGRFVRILLLIILTVTVGAGVARRPSEASPARRCAFRGVIQSIDAEMIRLYSLTMPVWRDEGNAYSAAFEAPGVPTSVLLDAHGALVQRWIGRVDFRAADVTTQIDSLLPR